MIASWPCPLAGGTAQEELAIAFDKGRTHRLLILLALFDEGNKLRRLTLDIMRRLDLGGVDSFLPDLPGCNESMQTLAQQSLTQWRDAAQAAASHFHATHLLTIRAAAMLAPPNLPGWRYAPAAGGGILRTMLRAAQIAAREAGREATLANLAEAGRENGIDLAGYRIGPQLFTDLEQARLADEPHLSDIPQDMLGESGLWLRAEPGESKAQADRLANILIAGLHA